MEKGAIWLLFYLEIIQRFFKIRVGLDRLGL